MRIAQVAPLAESVPPRLYGGTERVVHNLTEELVHQGHQVTLFASGDSRTSARLVATVPRAFRLDPQLRDRLPYSTLQLEQVRVRAEEFDVIHFHNDFLHLPLCRALPVPAVTTQHGRMDLADIVPLFETFQDAPLVSVSNAQRGPLPDLNWRATVYHGMPPRQCPYNPQPAGDYLIFIGRLAPEKGCDVAIEIARRAGMKLKIVAKVDPADEQYFHEVIEPLLAQPHVDYVGEQGDVEKGRLLGNALALLFPIQWCEPFGMVLIEAMSCGTPVVAWNRGSVPELVEPGRSGFIVQSVDEALEALAKIPKLSRSAVRKCFDARFSVRRMVRDYLSVYRSLVEAPWSGAADSLSIDT